MNDYLFNASGEADEEIRKLECLLGELKFDPRPLGIGAQEQLAANAAQRSFSFFPNSFFLQRLPTTLLAAAAIVFTFALTGIWFGWFMLRPQIVVESTNQPSSSPTQIQNGAIQNGTPSSEPNPRDQQPLDTFANSTSPPVQAQSSPPPAYPSLTGAKTRPAHQRSSHRATTAIAHHTRRTPTPSQQAAEDLLLALKITGESLYRTQRHLEASLSSTFYVDAPANIMR